MAEEPLLAELVDYLLRTADEDRPERPGARLNTSRVTSREK